MHATPSAIAAIASHSWNSEGSHNFSIDGSFFFVCFKLKIIIEAHAMHDNISFIKHRASVGNTSPITCVCLFRCPYDEPPLDWNTRPCTPHIVVRYSMLSMSPSHRFHRMKYVYKYENDDISDMRKASLKIIFMTMVDSDGGGGSFNVATRIGV